MLFAFVLMLIGVGCSTEPELLVEESVVSDSLEQVVDPQVEVSESDSTLN